MNEWTLIIYANGNNELAPEMCKIIKDITNEPISGKIDVVVQLAREGDETLRLIRPAEEWQYEKDKNWNGTKRFIYNSNGLSEVEDLGVINMADTQYLYDFITWVCKKYPAKRYMLAIGGHIYQFVGMLFDYSQDKPYIAGFPEISLAVYKACVDNGIIIDVFVLDTCYASTFEVLYEFGHYEEECIKYILTYVRKGPIRGLPYDNIINIISENIGKDTEGLIKDIVLNISKNEIYNLIGYKINYKILENYKKLFNSLAYTYITRKESMNIDFTPCELLSRYDAKFPWAPYIENILKMYKGLIVEYVSKEKHKSGWLLISVMNKKIEDDARKYLYNRLSFSKNNYWAYLLCGRAIDEIVEYPQIYLKPMGISSNILYTTISETNEHLSDYQKKDMLLALGKLKGWNI